jgi:putative ABC transport system permease protein
MSRSIRPTRLTKPAASAATAEPPATSAKQVTPLESLLHDFRMQKHQQRGSLMGASFSSAVEAVWANRTRSLLTILGIVIGITAVIGALTLTQGVGAFITSLILSQGANTIFIQPGAASSRGVVSKQAVQDLSEHDLLTLGKLPHVAGVTPIVFTGGQVVYGNQNWKTSVEGVSTDMQSMQDWQLAEGLWFSQPQADGAEPVAVIGDTVMQNLFVPLNVDPIGKQIRIRDQLFKVVGVLAPKGGLGQDDVIFVPYKAAQVRLTNENFFNEIDVEADNKDNIDLLVQEITGLLEQNHHIPRGNPDDFQTTTSDQILQQSSQATQAITLLLTGIATISLTVGGIGIMNIMLVSVTERTREIGVRMSIGARRQDIRNQFLIEALVLCMIGGAIGLGVGVLLGWGMIHAIVSALSRGGGGNSGSLPLIITPVTLILPFGVSALIGIVFGLFPAIRASRLDPIVALRRAR